jgi:hypothetical protein
MRTARIISMTITMLAACAGNQPEDDAFRENLIVEVQALAKVQRPGGKRLGRSPVPVGVWRTKVYEHGAWVDLIWVIGRSHAWHAVTAYADEQLTVPLLRWDVVRAFELHGPHEQVEGARELTWLDLHGQLKAFVDDPVLFASLGLADCDLRPGQTRELATNNCGAPLFPFHHCEMMDFVVVEDDTLTFGDPRQGNRCEQRPTNLEAWSFERVPLTPELLRALLARDEEYRAIF